MKLILLAVLLAAQTVTAFAGDAWSDSDKARQVAYYVLHAYDWGQTRYVAKHHDKFTERNPFLNDKPSVGQVNTYFAVSAIGHYLIADALDKDTRAVFQYVTIGIEGAAIKHNIRVGVKVDF